VCVRYIMSRVWMNGARRDVPTGGRSEVDERKSIDITREHLSTRTLLVPAI